MPEALAAVLAFPALGPAQGLALGWLMVSGFAAGVVHGFAGFGAVLLFLPFASQIVLLAVAAFSLTALA